MGLINIYKPLSTFLLPALPINLSNIEINFWECRELNLGPLGEKQECFLCAARLFRLVQILFVWKAKDTFQDISYVCRQSKEIAQGQVPSAQVPYFFWLWSHGTTVMNILSAPQIEELRHCHVKLFYPLCAFSEYFHPTRQYCKLFNIIT